MARLRETIVTNLAPERAFAFVADFANSARWDPGVASSERLDDGPLAVGARYRLGVRMAGRVAPMEYRITELEPNRRVVLVGRGSNVEAVDEIAFEPTPEGGTRVDYSADIRLTGLLQLIKPLTGRAFASIARNARQGMQRTLDELAESGAPGETDEAAA
jgi:carbon monoxide dehydrogenase subunit G